MKKRDDDFDEEYLAGFRLEYVKGFVAGNMSSMKMLLPDSEDLDMFLLTREALAVEERDAAYEVTLKKERAIRKAKEAEESINEQNNSNRSSSSFSSSRNDLDPEKEKTKLYDKYIAQTGVPDPDKFQIYDWDEPLVLIKTGKNSTPDKDLRARNEKIYLDLRERGNFRSLSRVAPEKAIDQLELLRTQQPHFGSVIDLVREQILLAKARNSFVKIPPILLFGEPGIGKTHFSKQLAATLGTAIHCHSFDFVSTESSLIGSDKHWYNTTIGLLFNVIALGDCANPVLLLDELDKSSYVPGLSQKNPLAPLHSLLEPVTSSRIKDLSVEISFDTSAITFIATANVPQRVPATIRSRFIQFQIEEPSAVQALQLAKAVSVAISTEMKLSRFEPVGARIIALIAHLSAREMGQALRRAYASAVANERLKIENSDLPDEVLIDAPQLDDQRNKLH